MTSDWLRACLGAYPPPYGVESWFNTEGASGPGPALAAIPEEYRRAVHDLLLGLGILDPQTGGFASPNAYYFAHSLGHALHEKAFAPGAWQGSVRDSLSGGGARLLNLVETQRLVAAASPTPLRVVRAVSAVIKARRASDGAAVYLMQYDPGAGRFQPIGGKRELDDPSNEAALLREICEELNVQHLQLDVDFSIEPLVEHVQTAEVSASLNVITQYDHSFYLLRGVRFPIHTDGSTRWLEAAELEAGRTHDGLAITPRKNLHLAGRLPSLAYSVEQPLTS